MFISKLRSYHPSILSVYPALTLHLLSTYEVPETVRGLAGWTWACLPPWASPLVEKVNRPHECLMAKCLQLLHATTGGMVGSVGKWGTCFSFAVFTWGLSLTCSLLPFQTPSPDPPCQHDLVQPLVLLLHCLLGLAPLPWLLLSCSAGSGWAGLGSSSVLRHAPSLSTDLQNHFPWPFLLWVSLLRQDGSPSWHWPKSAFEALCYKSCQLYYINKSALFLRWWLGRLNFPTMSYNLADFFLPFSYC